MINVEALKLSEEEDIKEDIKKTLITKFAALMAKPKSYIEQSPSCIDCPNWEMLYTKRKSFGNGYAIVGHNHCKLHDFNPDDYGLCKDNPRLKLWLAE
jgi:hypothetical protein